MNEKPQNQVKMPTLETEVPTMPEVSKTPEETKKQDGKKTGIAIGISSVLVMLVVVISVVLTMHMQRGNAGDSGDGDGGAGMVDDGEEEEIIVLENTELTSGTVTTTIGGKTVTYSGAYVVDGINATIGSGTYESAIDNQAVFLVVNGGSLTIQGDVTINKTGSTNFQGRGDEYSFYGINSAIVVVGESSSVSINGATITTSVSGANAVVATRGGEVAIKNSAIATSKDNSRGLHATYGGTITADKVVIETQGGSSATLATDRGSGIVVAKNMTLSTAGAGSPLIYSTGEIEVSDSTGIATGAQIAVVEGKNSIVLDNCEFSANGVGNRNSVDNAAVMIYQSMSGDASVGTGSFTATGCVLTVLPTSSVYTTTPFFFVTNTTATIVLDDVTADFYEGGYLILASGTDEWGKSGTNGGIVTIEATELTASNTQVYVGENSSVNGL